MGGNPSATMQQHKQLRAPQVDEEAAQEVKDVSPSATVLYDFTAAGVGQLDVRAGETVELQERQPVRLLTLLHNYVCMRAVVQPPYTVWSDTNLHVR